MFTIGIDSYALPPRAEQRRRPADTASGVRGRIRLAIARFLGLGAA